MMTHYLTQNTLKTPQVFRKPSKQQGAVLVMALMMLFVLTLIGVSSISTTSMEEKMSGNTRNRHLAFQSAESAIIAAERQIQTTIFNPGVQFNNAAGLYSLGNGPSSNNALDPAWWAANSRVPYPLATQDINTPPQYVIEFLGAAAQVVPNDIEIKGGEDEATAATLNTFRITSRGTGLTDNSVVVIQSHFGLLLLL